MHTHLCCRQSNIELISYLYTCSLACRSPISAKNGNKRVSEKDVISLPIMHKAAKGI